MAQEPQVLVTRAPGQGSVLAQHLLSLGLEPVLIPAIEIVPPSSFEGLDSALDCLDSFDWIVFTSANAAPVFADRMRGRTVPRSVKVAAIGQATATALVSAGLTVDLVPPQAVAESLADALLPSVQATARLRQRVLVIRAQEGRDHLPERLHAAGAEVTLAAAYRTVVAEGSTKRLIQLLRPGESRLRAITFTSSSTVRNLLALCEAADVTLPETARRVSIGPITSATLREAGLPPHAEAPVATTESLAQTVAAVLRGD